VFLFFSSDLFTVKKNPRDLTEGDVDDILYGQENTITLAAPISLSPTLKPLFDKPFDEKHERVQGMKTYLSESKMT